MLDDDGFIFEGNTVTYIKVIDSTETDACKKQRAGQCFRADAPAITVTRNRKGEAEFTPAPSAFVSLAAPRFSTPLNWRII